MNEVKNFWEECYKSFGISVDSKINSIFDEEIECTDIFLSLLEKGSTVLDYGCGIGKNSISLLKKGFNVTIGDISETSIEVCKENIIKYGFEVNVLSCDNKIEYNCSFDGILAWNILDHMPLTEATNLLDDLYRICNKDGLLMCSFHEKNSFYNNNYRKLEDGNITFSEKSDEKMLIRFFTNEEIITMFKDKWEILYFSAAIEECEKVIICRKK